MIFIMADNLYSPKQKVLTREGKDNFSRIFGDIPYPEEKKDAAVRDILRRHSNETEKV